MDSLADILEQIRAKYREASLKYGSRFFNLQELEERIIFMRLHKISVDIFVRQEIDFYRKLKEKAEKKYQEKINREEVHRRVEEIMAANSALIEKYPDNFFDPRASYEMRRLTGAITELFPLIEYTMTQFARGSKHWRQIKDALSDLEWFFLPQDRRPAGFLRHYCEVLAKGEINQIESTERQLMQTAGLALHKIAVLSEEELEAMPQHSRAMLFPVNGLAEPLRESVKACGVEQVIRKVNSRMRAIIADFRLQDLVNYASGQRSV